MGRRVIDNSRPDIYQLGWVDPEQIPLTRTDSDFDLRNLFYSQESYFIFCEAPCPRASYTLRKIGDY